MGTLEYFIVSGLVFSSFIKPASGKTLTKNDRVEREYPIRYTGLDKLPPQTIRGYHDLADRLDSCSHDPNSNIQKLVASFEMTDGYGFHTSKCEKQKWKPGLEDGVVPLHQSITHELYNRNYKRNLLKDVNLWPNGVVNYVITSFLFSQEFKNLINAAMKEISDKTCITFKQENIYNPKGPYIDFINFWTIEPTPKYHCWSVLGRNPEGTAGFRQRIILHSRFCNSKAAIIHEILHALGFVHEQNRSDRDENVKIIMDNVKENEKKLFTISDTVDTNPYDMSSVMQYSLYAYSKGPGKKTMESLYNRLGFLAGSATGLSFYDVQDITDAYRCAAKCQITDKHCENEGFVNHLCQCQCPRGLKGSKCELLDTDPDCGEMIDLSSGNRMIRTPGYQASRYPIGKRCTWLVKTTGGKRISARFRNLNLSYSHTTGNCYHWIEVKFHILGQTGKRGRINPNLLGQGGFTLIYRYMYNDDVLSINNTATSSMSSNKLCGSSRNLIETTTPHGNKNQMMLIFDSRTVLNRPQGAGAEIVLSTID